MFKHIFAGIAVLSTTFGCSNHPTQQKPSNIENPAEEFQFSEAEKKEVQAFLKKIKTSDTFELDKVIDAAYDGDPVAMYIAGQTSLSGTGTSINREAANLHFKMAASLGYAPALHEVFSMYVTEGDPLLALVYLNLTISSGHKEYRDLYYQQTEQLSKIAGKSVVKEIEKIALGKTVAIGNAQKDIESRKNTYKPALTLVGQNLVSYDLIYTKDYWKRFFESQDSWEKFYGVPQ